MLRPHEPPPVEIVRPEAGSRVLLVCDHASNRLPEALGDLGLPGGAIDTHIGWDIGAAAVARHLSVLLDATLVLTSYSRLVIDANRPVHVAGSIPAASGGVPVPGNADLDPAARESRIATFFRPYHAAITRILDARSAAPGHAAASSHAQPASGEPAPVLLAIHSFTPELFGQKRPWPISLLYGKDTRLAHAFLGGLRRDPALLVGDNEPYRVTPDTDWTLPTHGESRGILHTAFEIRQDGVAGAAGQRAWAERIAETFRSLSL